MGPTEKNIEGTRQGGPRKPAKNKEGLQQVLNEEAKQVDNGTALIQWKRQMEAIKSEFLEQMHSQLGGLFDKALKEATHAFPQPSRKASAEMQNREKHPFDEKQKVFINQQSLIDELLEVKHFRSIYNMLLVTLCAFTLSIIAVDFIDKGWVVLDFKLLFFAFGNLSQVLFTWLGMFLYTLLVPYKLLQIWASSLRTGEHFRLFTTITAMILLVGHAAVLGFYPIYTVIFYQMGPASCFIVTLEQFRFIMKTHSFLRESVPPILYASSKDGKVRVPEFSTYLYFLFCPTMIYKENYPRTPCVRWRYVISNFTQFFGCILFTNFFMEHYCFPFFTNMSKQPLSFKTLVLSIVFATWPGIIILWLSFFAFMHCWLNAFAEMLRFADRGFYKDWWNSTSFSRYFRTWNVVIHDWLFRYIYLDLIWLFQGKASVVAKLSAFFASAAVHEYAYTMSFGFFYPVCFTLFAIFGVILNFIFHDKRKGPIWNLIFWASLFLGQGMQFCLYSQEWYARIQCPLQETTFWGIVTPRSWTCHS